MIDLEQIRKLSFQDGDVLLLPKDATDEDVCALSSAIRSAYPGQHGLIIRGDLKLLDEAAMNAAGWYRR